MPIRHHLIDISIIPVNPLSDADSSMWRFDEPKREARVKPTDVGPGAVGGQPGPARGTLDLSDSLMSDSGTG